MTLFRPWSEIAVKCRLGMNVPSKAKKNLQGKDCSSAFSMVQFAVACVGFRTRKDHLPWFLRYITANKKGRIWIDTQKRRPEYSEASSFYLLLAPQQLMQFLGWVGAGENKNTFLNSPESCSVEPLNWLFRTNFPFYTNRGHYNLQLRRPSLSLSLFLFHYGQLFEIWVQGTGEITLGET